MPSLSQLLSDHHSILVLDAASSQVQVGILSDDGQARWQSSGNEATSGVFQCVEALGGDPNSVGAFVFCEGPGSILGIRTTAMAVRTWNVVAPRPTYAYCSLAVLAAQIGDPRVGVIADARRDSWHYYRLDGKLRRVNTNDLNGPLVMPQNFRHWSPLPSGVATVPYSLADLLPQISDTVLFHPTDAPDAFLHEEPSYATWTPQVHRAPSST